MTTLLLSARHTGDNQRLWRAAVARGWTVARVRGVTPPSIDDEELAFHIEALTGFEIARRLGYRLLDPPEDWLPRVPREFTHRIIRLTDLGTARNESDPVFVKPPNDKSFPAAVYGPDNPLPEEFEASIPVLVAEPVFWEQEFRCFCLDGIVQSVSPYLRFGQLAEETGYELTDDERSTVVQFTESVLTSVVAMTPRAIVIDVGQIADRGWAVVEANGAWGSGLYGCDPEVVLDLLPFACAPLG